MEVYNSTEKPNNNISEGEQQPNATEKVIIGHDKITNMVLLDNFLDNTDKYNKEKTSCRVEIVTYTIEGDEIITTLEYNKDTSRTKMKNAKLKAEETSTEELVYYNGILYGEAYVRIDYMPNPEGPIGTINKLIGKDYLPQLNGETNAESLLNAKVDSADDKSMILIVDNVGVLFNAIEIE